MRYPALYLTDNDEYVKSVAKIDYRLSGTRDDYNLLFELKDVDCTVYIKINKAPHHDILLKFLESNYKPRIIAQAPKRDVKEAILSRFFIYEAPNKYTEDAKYFLQYKQLKDKKAVRYIDFYIAIADALIISPSVNLHHNVLVISDIIKDIQMATNNIFADDFINRLRRLKTC